MRIASFTWRSRNCSDASSVDRSIPAARQHPHHTPPSRPANKCGTPPRAAPTAAVVCSASRMTPAKFWRYWTGGIRPSPAATTAPRARTGPVPTPAPPPRIGTTASSVDMPEIQRWRSRKTRGRPPSASDEEEAKALCAMPALVVGTDAAVNVTQAPLARCP